ncbi:hypothetical protein L7F22_000286 [Adiantum nelumboides]|nr:hypothetical protein [Adiantum nelumboides]
MIIDCVDETLEAVKIAMDNRVALKEACLPNLPGPPPKKVHKLPPFKANLEPIIESHESEEVRSKQGSGSVLVPDFEKGIVREICHELGPEDPMKQDFLPSLDENLATQLWEEVREKLTTKGDEKKPPLSAIALSHEWDQLESEKSMPIWEKTSDVASEDSFLKTLPEFVGDYEARTKIIHVPLPNTRDDELERDVTNLQALMSAPVTCTIPLADLLKIRLEECGWTF